MYYCTNICNNMDESQKHYAVEKKAYRIILFI